MRLVAVLATALLLSGCTWVHKELPWTAPPTPAVPAPATPKPEPKPHARLEKPSPPAPVAQVRDASPVAAAPAEAPVDYAARCRTMAANRADDAKGLGASPADQSKVRDETYRDCMQQSVK